jgi:hypothetical protein
MALSYLFGASISAVSLFTHITAASSPSQWQQMILGPQQETEWQKYIRSPLSEIVRPARVLSDYTTGNVTNGEGLLNGKGSTILTRMQPSVAPTIVVDFGQNTVGILSIKFGGSYNLTMGLPSIRLAFSETMEYLTERSDFTRSYNVSYRMVLF